MTTLNETWEWPYAHVLPPPAPTLAEHLISAAQVLQERVAANLTTASDLELAWALGVIETLIAVLELVTKRSDRPAQQCVEGVGQAVARP